MVGIAPELAEALLERPGPHHLEVGSLQGLEGGPLLGGHGRRAHEPEVLVPCQASIAVLLEHPVFRPPHLVHSLMEMLGDMEFGKTILASASSQWAHVD